MEEQEKVMKELVKGLTFEKCYVDGEFKGWEIVFKGRIDSEKKKNLEKALTRYK